MKGWRKYQEVLVEADWHIHTKYTDGHNTVDEYCQKALEYGLKSIAFTEHVRRDLTYDFRSFLQDIEHAKSRYPLTILSGCEVKVLDDRGTIDADESLLNSCDIVVGVFHGFPFQDKQKFIEAVLALLGNPFVQVWGHPLHNQTHVLSMRDIERILHECRRRDVLMERNMRYNVPDDSFIRTSRDIGVPMIVSTDAHSISELMTRAQLKREWERIERLSDNLR